MKTKNLTRLFAQSIVLCGLLSGTGSVFGMVAVTIDRIDKAIGKIGAADTQEEVLKAKKEAEKFFGSLTDSQMQSLYRMKIDNAVKKAQAEILYAENKGAEENVEAAAQAKKKTKQLFAQVQKQAKALQEKQDELKRLENYNNYLAIEQTSQATSTNDAITKVNAKLAALAQSKNENDKIAYLIAKLAIALLDAKITGNGDFYVEKAITQRGFENFLQEYINELGIIVRTNVTSAGIWNELQKNILTLDALNKKVMQ